jgi:formylglycine-generating enzyme required for sulfatase activity
MLYARNRYIVTMEDFANFVGITRKEYSLGQKKIYYFESPSYYNKNRRAVVEEMVQELLMKKIRMG